MKLMSITIIAAAILTQATVAQEDLTVDQSKLYATDPAACQALEDRGVDAWLDLDFLSLTFAGGIQSMEFHCNLYDVQSRPNTPVLFINAVCEMPGELYADTIAIAPHDDGAIRVVSTADTTMGWLGEGQVDPENPYPAGTTIYHRCDNLSEIPVD